MEQHVGWVWAGVGAHGMADNIRHAARCVFLCTAPCPQNLQLQAAASQIQALARQRSLVRTQQRVRLVRALRDAQHVDAAPL